MSVFHAYDVRGIYPEGVNEELAEKIGLGLAAQLGPGPVGIARDMRPSSTPLCAALTAGLKKAGREVVDFGMLTTPCFYYGVGSLGLAGGVMVTASHNPAQYNGFKICREKTIPIGRDSGLKELEESILAGDLPEAEAAGTSREEDVSDAYLNHVVSRAVAPIAPLKIAVDAGNGVAGPLARRLFSRFEKVELQEMYFEPDGTFPNHEANPLNYSTLDDLRARVRDEGLDLGIAFDGDGDRAAFIDEQGEIVPNDLLTAFLADALLPGEPGAVIIYDLRSSRVVEETIKAGGGVPLEERVGHAFIKKTMRDRDALLGGELSGHYYWRDNFYADSAFLAVTQVLAIRSRSGKPLSELIAPFRRTERSGEINYLVEDKDGVIAALGERFSDAQISHLDGITVRYEGWWFNVRKSNTEPLLRLNLETSSASLLEEKLAILDEALGGQRA